MFDFPQVEDDLVGGGRHVGPVSVRFSPCFFASFGFFGLFGGGRWPGLGVYGERRRRARRARRI